MQEFEWHLDIQQVKIYRCSTTCCGQINPIEFCYQDKTNVQWIYSDLQVYVYFFFYQNKVDNHGQQIVDILLIYFVNCCDITVPICLKDLLKAVNEYLIQIKTFPKNWRKKRAIQEL